MQTQTLRSTITWNRARRKEKRRKNNLEFVRPKPLPRRTSNKKKPDPGKKPYTQRASTHTTVLHRSFLFYFSSRVKEPPAQSAQVSRFLTAFSASFPPKANEQSRTIISHLLHSHPPLKKKPPWSRRLFLVRFFYTHNQKIRADCR